MAPVGNVTVKVIPDVSDIEPLIKAEMARAVAAAGATLGEVDIEHICDVLTDCGRFPGAQEREQARRLRERFLILERNAS